MDNSSSHVESRWRTQLRNRIIQASSLLEILLSGLVLIGLLLSAVPLIKWMPGLLFDGNEVEIRIFLERSLDIVIGIEFIKMLAKHSPGSSLEVLLYAIARHLVVGHDSAVENLLSVGAIALIFIVRKFFFVPAFGAHLPDGHPAPDLSPRQSGIPAEEFRTRLRQRINIFNIGRDAYRRILQIAFDNPDNWHAHHRTRGLQICHTFNANGNRARLFCR
jgi:phosphate starvation-inducible membrane PsiE